MSILIKDGFDFTFDSSICKKACNSFCCKGESGNIWINKQEIEEVSDFLNINSFDFIQKYLNRIDNRFSIKENYTQKGFECIFLTGKHQTQCSIYPVRPFQCKTFPFWNYFKKKEKLLLKECPGVKLI